MKRTNKLLALLLAALMVVSVLPLTVAAEEKPADAVANGGTKVYDAEDFLKIGDAPHLGYELMNDIDFTNVKIDTPYVIKEFYGALDGNGYAVKNVTISYTGTADVDKVGLIGHLGAIDATPRTGEVSGTVAVTDLVIDNMSITVAPEADGTYFSAGFLTAGNNSDAVKPPVVSGVHVKNSKLNASLPAYTQTTKWSSLNRPAVGVGGIVGSLPKAITISNCSLDADTEINVTYNKSCADAVVAGILAFGTGSQVARKVTVIDSCVNNATINVVYKFVYDGVNNVSSGSDHVVGIFGFSHSFYVIKDCVNNGAISVTTDCTDEGTVPTAKIGAIMGNCAQGNNPSYVLGCHSNWNDLPVFGNKVGGVKGYNYVNGAPSGQNQYTPVKTAEEFAALNGKSGALLYVLEPENGIIDMGTAATSIAAFDACVYGNGATVKGTYTSGVFNTTGANKFAVIADVKFDISLNVPDTSTGNVGGIVNATGKGWDTIMIGVEANFTNANVSGMYVGGLIGYGRAPILVDCRVSGTFNVENTAISYVSPIAARMDNTGTAVGSGNQDRRIQAPAMVVGCETDVDVVLNGTATCNYGAFTAAVIGSSWCNIFADCTNYGDVTVKSDASVSHVIACISTIGHGYNAISGCDSYSNIITLVGSDASDDKNYSGNTLIDDKFNMNQGASVRINEVTGIRFTSKFNADLIKHLEAKYGAEAVSYGTIIAPKAIVDAAGEFTTAKLDALKAGNDAYANVTMYNDIVADKDAWFEGVEGQIAGSITGLEGLYAMNLIGRGYIKVVVDGEVVFEMYADYADGNIANNTRSVARVAANALGDYAEGSDEYKALSAILAAAKIN